MFFKKFLRRYWNEQAQHELKRKLEFGAHSGGRGGSRTEYATRLYVEAKEPSAFKYVIMAEEHTYNLWESSGKEYRTKHKWKYRSESQTDGE